MLEAEYDVWRRGPPACCSPRTRVAGGKIETLGGWMTPTPRGPPGRNLIGCNADRGHHLPRWALQVEGLGLGKAPLQPAAPRPPARSSNTISPCRG